MNNNKIFTRIVMYFVGLFIMTAGIALSVKSNLGVSPVSSIPYTFTCIFGFELGWATIGWHCFLVLLQIIILRKNFKLISLLQVPVGFVFGKFTTLCNGLCGLLPPIESLWIRGILILISIVLIALGIFFYMPSNIMPLAAEGFMDAMNKVTNIPFHKCKIIFDVTVVVISLISCMTYFMVVSKMTFVEAFVNGSVNIGTIAAAVLVGMVLGCFNRWWGNWRDNFLGVEKIKNEELKIKNDESVEE